MNYHLAKKQTNMLWRSIYILLVLLGLGGSVFIFSLRATPEKLKESTPVIKESTVIPTKAVDKTQYALIVLNGSGVAGRAAETKKILEKEGFIVSAIGNADRATYTTSIIRVNEQIDTSFTHALEKILDIYYPSDINEEVASTEKEITIIVGRDTAH